MKHQFSCPFQMFDMRFLIYQGEELHVIEAESKPLNEIAIEDKKSKKPEEEHHQVGLNLI